MSAPVAPTVRRPIPSAGQLRELADLAVAMATETGHLLVNGRPADLVETAGTKTSLTDPVTIMDTRAERLLRERIHDARPDDGMLGEEGASLVARSGLTWVVDPLDGTTNYLYDLPMYAVSVAVVIGDPNTPGAWQPVAAAVCAPMLGTTWSAYLGGGARRLGPACGHPVATARPKPQAPGIPSRDTARDRSLGDGTVRDGSPGDGMPVCVSVRGDLQPALVGTGFSYRAEHRAQQARVLTTILPAVRDVRRMGSAAVDLCFVADGRLDGFFEVGLNSWDVAAGWLIVTEAGGTVTGSGGGAPGPDLVVAANPALHPALAALVGSAIAL